MHNNSLSNCLFLPTSGISHVVSVWHVLAKLTANIANTNCRDCFV